MHFPSTRTSFNPLLDYRYHDLLESLSHATDTAVQTTIPVQTVMHAFFSTLGAHVHKVEPLGKLLEAAAKSFHTLLSSVREDQSSTAGKAEGWLDVLGLMLTWIDKENIQDCLYPAERLLRAVGTELVVSLDVAQNRKKVSCNCANIPSECVAKKTLGPRSPPPYSPWLRLCFQHGSPIPPSGPP